MKTTAAFASILGFATFFATAAPVNNARHDIVRRSPESNPALPPYPRGAAYPSASHPSSYPTASRMPLPSSGHQPPYPTGTAPTYPYPTAPSVPPYLAGTAPASPYPTAPSTSSTTCSPNGKLICNGTSEFGLCNWGKVIFQPVANGTACVNGSITWAADYPH